MARRFNMLGFVGVMAACASTAHAAATAITDFSVQRWTQGAGADGRMYALIMVDAHWSWREARALAQDMGGDLAATPNSQTLAFVTELADNPSAFDCAGPWVGGFMFGGHPWQWTNDAPFVSFAWAPGRPIQAALLDAAICLGGSDGPDGTLFDSLPGPDAGATTKSAVVVWNSFTDCNRNEVPDLLEIAADPKLDRDFDGAIDGCTRFDPADLNHDGLVDGADLGTLLGAWGTHNAQGDINQDGIVDGADLGMLLGAWTTGG